MWMCLFLQQKDLLSHFRWWKYKRHFYMSRSTPEGLWMVHTPGAKKKKRKLKWRTATRCMWKDKWIRYGVKAIAEETKSEKKASHNDCNLSKCVRYILVHISWSSWQRKFPWHRSQSLDLCDAGSGQCNTALLQGTEPETGLGPALLPLGTDTPLPSLYTYRINDVFIIV